MRKPWSKTFDETNGIRNNDKDIAVCRPNHWTIPNTINLHSNEKYRGSMGNFNKTIILLKYNFAKIIISI